MSSTKRPYTICHMMFSIDGKIASGIPGLELFDRFFDLYTKKEDEMRGQAWLLGRVTMEMFANGEKLDLPNPAEMIVSEDFVSQSESGLYMIGVDTKGLLRWNGNTIKLGNVDIPLSLLIAVTQETPQGYLQYLRNLGISYIFSGENKIDFDDLLKKLKSHFEINTILLEGGGLMNGSMLQDDKIDEISLLLLPVVVNHSGAPSLFEYKQIDNIDLKDFSLAEVDRFEQDTVHLRYQRKR